MRERMIAAVDAGADLADHEATTVAVGVRRAPRDSLPMARQPNLQAPQRDRRAPIGERNQVCRPGA